MNRSVNVVARSLGFVWVGILAFGLYPPTGRAELVLQAVTYALAALGMIAWALIDYVPSAARYRPRGLTVVLAVIAAAMGAGAISGNDGGLVFVVFALVAAMQAGGDVDRVAAIGYARRHDLG
jgi:hypothetical protein